MVILVAESTNGLVMQSIRSLTARHYKPLLYCVFYLRWYALLTNQHDLNYLFYKIYLDTLCVK